MTPLQHSKPWRVDEELAPGAVRGVAGVLLDFDGPICSLFTHDGADTALSAVVKALEKGGQLPEDLRKETNAHALLRSMSVRGSRYVEEANGALAEQERVAARNAVPTDGSGELIAALAGLGIPMAIASNNSKAAIVDYLQLHGLEEHFAGRVHGRANDLTCMKPHPFCVDQALSDIQVGGDALLLGDSPSDGEAAAASHIGFIGCVHPEVARGGSVEARQVRLLRAAGAKFVVRDLWAVTAAFRTRTGI